MGARVLSSEGAVVPGAQDLLEETQQEAAQSQPGEALDHAVHGHDEAKRDGARAEVP